MLAVVAYLGLVRLGAGGHHHVGDHVLGAVLEATGLLHPGTAAATHVDLGAGQGGGAAPGAGHLEHDHLGAAIGGLDRGAAAGAAQADDDHIGLPVPLLHIRSLRGWEGLVGVEWDICSGLYQGEPILRHATIVYQTA